MLGRPPDHRTDTHGDGSSWGARTWAIGPRGALSGRAPQRSRDGFGDHGAQGGLEVQDPPGGLRPPRAGLAGAQLDSCAMPNSPSAIACGFGTRQQSFGKSNYSASCA